MDAADLYNHALLLVHELQQHEKPEDAALILADALAEIEAAAPPKIGDNSGAIDLVSDLDGDRIRRWLTVKNEDVAARAALLLDAHGRMKVRLAENEGITDDEELGKAAAFEAQMRGHAKTIESRREEDRKPVLEAGKVMQNFYKERLVDPLIGAADEVRQFRTIYLQKKEAEARAKLEAERKAAQEAADRAAAIAAAAATPEADDAAIKADEAAAAAERAAAVKPAELTRVRSDLGVTSSLRRVLKFRVEDKAKVPDQYKMVVDATVMAASKTVKDPTVEQPVPGIVFYYESAAR